jgi:hypothetical protein
MVSIAPGGAFVTRALVISNGTTVRAPAGWIFLAGTHLTSIEDSRFSSAADQFGRGMLLGGAVSPSCRGSEFRTKQAELSSGGGAARVRGSNSWPGARLSQCPVAVFTSDRLPVDRSVVPGYRRRDQHLQPARCPSRAPGPGTPRNCHRHERRPTIVNSELNSRSAPSPSVELAGWRRGSTLTAMNAAGILLSGELRSRLLAPSRGAAHNPELRRGRGLTRPAGLLTETSGGGNSLTGVRSAPLPSSSAPSTTRPSRTTICPRRRTSSARRAPARRRKPAQYPVLMT